MPDRAVAADGRPLPVIRDLTLPSALSLLVAGLLALTSVAGMLFGHQGLYSPTRARCRRSWARTP
jgi:hypothetical protein